MIMLKTRSMLVFGMGVLMLQSAAASKRRRLPTKNHRRKKDTAKRDAWREALKKKQKEGTKAARLMCQKQKELDKHRAITPAEDDRDWVFPGETSARGLWSEAVSFCAEECPESSPGILRGTFEDFFSAYHKFFCQIYKRDSSLRNISTVTGACRGLAKGLGWEDEATFLKCLKYGYKHEILGKSYSELACSFIASLYIKTVLKGIYKELDISDYKVLTFVLTRCTKQAINSYVDQTGYAPKLSKALYKFSNSMVEKAEECTKGCFRGREEYSDEADELVTTDDDLEQEFEAFHESWI